MTESTRTEADSRPNLLSTAKAHPKSTVSHIVLIAGLLVSLWSNFSGDSSPEGTRKTATNIATNSSPKSELAKTPVKTTEETEPAKVLVKTEVAEPKDEAEPMQAPKELVEETETVLATVEVESDYSVVGSYRLSSKDAEAAAKQFAAVGGVTHRHKSTQADGDAFVAIFERPKKPEQGVVAATVTDKTVTVTFRKDPDDATLTATRPAVSTLCASAGVEPDGEWEGTGTTRTLAVK